MIFPSEKSGLDDLSAAPDRMPEVLARFQADRECLERLFPAVGSPRRAERMRRFLDDGRRSLESLPFRLLTYSDRIDWLLFRSLLESEGRRLEREMARFESAAEALLPFADDLIALDDRRRALSEVEPEKAAGLLDGAGERIRALRAALEKGEVIVSPTLAGQGAKVAAQLRTTLEKWFSFYSGYHPAFDWWVEKPYRMLDGALGEYGVFLREKVAGADGDTVLGEPLGRDALLAELRAAQVPYTPEELIEAAREEMDWCRAEMREAAREMGLGDDWRAALERVKTEHVEPGEQPALVRDLAYEAIAYVEENDLVTVPSLARECWRMEMMSPERQRVNPFFLGGEAIVVSFPTSDMEHERKRMSLRGNNRAFARATVHHELIPGHHLQMFSQMRYRPYRRIFYTPFWTEGWTLHWEMLLWERRFARTPEERIGMLFWRTHRCARVIFSLGFHLGRMTPGECVEMLVSEGGHERDNALAEVRRSFEGSYDPLYQCAYQIGAWQMHALYREMTGEGGMSDREFHDAVLRENCMPIPVLRALLRGMPLSEEGIPEWRFSTRAGT